jgi:hypothetical protein
MTDAEAWEQAPFLKKLRFLMDRSSDRKRRLYVCACCRRLWPLLSERGRRAIELGEQAADGLASLKEVRVMEFAPDDASPADATAALAVFALTAYPAGRVSEDVEQILAGTVADADVDAPAFWEAYRQEGTVTASQLDDLLGNPARPVALDRAWLARDEAPVVRLARVIYDERAFDRLPILADALEEAGCTDAAILRHCREPGPHVRGCWVLDLILGKE